MSVTSRLIKNSTSLALPARIKNIFSYASSLPETTKKVANFIKRNTPNSIKKNFFFLFAGTHAFVLGRVHNETWALGALTMYAAGYLIYKNGSRICVQLINGLNAIYAHKTMIAVTGLFLMKNLVPVIKNNKILSWPAQAFCVFHALKMVGLYFCKSYISDDRRNRLFTKIKETKIATIWKKCKLYSSCAVIASFVYVLIEVIGKKNIERWFFDFIRMCIQAI